MSRVQSSMCVRVSVVVVCVCVRVVVVLVKDLLKNLKGYESKE